jgi:hypothetical protein
VSHKLLRGTAVACVASNHTEDGIGYGMIDYVLWDAAGLYGRVGLG